MNGEIGRIVAAYFEDKAYSPEAERAQGKIEETLAREFDETAREKGKSAALDAFLAKYSGFEDMARAAGYGAEDAAAWQESELSDLKAARRAFLRARLCLYAASAFLAVSVTELLAALVELIQGQYKNALFYLLYIALFALAAGLLIRRAKGLRRAKFPVVSYSCGVFAYLRGYKDRYKKRALNGLAAAAALVAILIFSEISLYVFAVSKLSEVVEDIYARFLYIDLAVFVCAKNLLCLRFMGRLLPQAGDGRYARHLRLAALIFAAYWLLVLGATFVLRSLISQYMNFYLAAAALFLAGVFAYNMTLWARVTYRNLVVNARRAAAWGLIAVLAVAYNVMQKDTWYTQSYINTVAAVPGADNEIAYDDDTGVYTITMAGDEFRILQLTDIHLGGSLYSYRKDLKALKACYDLIEYARPDLVVVTGDLSFPMGIMSLSLNNVAPVMQFASFMRNVGVPWAFTYGNHDTEAMASGTSEDLNSVFMSLAFKTSGNLLYPYTQPGVMGRNNQTIRLENPDGSLNQLLFLIDSNAYTGEGINVYDFIHDDQVDWYARQVKKACQAEGRTVSSMAFFHIPLQEYRTAYELYEAGSDEVTWFFGENGERVINKICCSDYPSKLFDAALELGSTKAFFCGHDHYNNMSLEYRGARLTYGMSIDYLVMPGIERDTAQRGGTLITVRGDSTYDIRQIPLTSIQGQE